MRLLSFAERDELCSRADRDLLDFVEELQHLGRKHRMRHQELLSVFLHAPTPTNVPEELILYARRMMAEDGVEYTPAQVEKIVETALCKIRNILRDAGVQDIEVDDMKLIG